jgi:hypothetical protein
MTVRFINLRTVTKFVLFLSSFFLGHNVMVALSKTNEMQPHRQKLHLIKRVHLFNYLLGINRMYRVM